MMKLLPILSLFDLASCGSSPERVSKPAPRTGDKGDQPWNIQFPKTGQGLFGER